MFPEQASFICRKCLCHFSFAPADFAQLATMNEIDCPDCGMKYEHYGNIKKFFTFYPRFTAGIDALKICGFEFVNYGFSVNPIMFDIDTFDFRCLNCGKTSSYSSKQAYQFADIPRLFACKKCRLQSPKVTPVKEFFASFRQIDRASSLGINRCFLWNIFQPLHLEPSGYPIQHLSYGGVELR